MEIHKPVLLNKVIEYLEPKQGDKIIDGTFGLGGHSREIGERIKPSGQVLGIEATKELYDLAVSGNQMKNTSLVNDNFVNLKKIAQENGFMNADGILLDLGVSSWHFDESDKGFTFQKDQDLNMRLGDSGVTAKEIINEYSEDDLVRILKEYGEESFAKRIASKIIEKRKENPINTTFELVEVIKEAVPAWYTHRRLHFATKTFQALRIEINSELDNLKKVLSQALEVLKPGGHLVVISFHAGEDRIVKNFFRDNKKEGVLKILTKKPVVPDREEVKENPRSRSAKLRAIQFN
ncbi:MAG: 16S rRNA (cytosine(1402)-N(4))-methyltransferase [Candidatus Yanofskybacteria bacterium CG10_big_fil_rev_8_21_14_0_10_36_16]|uniref:Ribosomal RNA small subunit methyltransferase H n=1 Tax=Candidatus Yanofskybacteria bacterium CG10_big_fil_rev_8_21_14_0_10_36_16 TaxID=1975096 RepID=A0A2J0Q7G3_9BACT|nr:MAG: 16S rRNA (cytosine(1402)-N(4))-methyltransferase [Candidatus Yanofskybacteria bacterium CG10_big_fil_rev_8_21_14_0_10_36_16]